MLIPKFFPALAFFPLGLLVGLPASAITDPTQPPPAKQVEQMKANKPKAVKAAPLEAVSSYKLGALVHSGGQQTAYVNNKLHKVGDKLGSYKISVIDTDHIHLRHGGSEWRVDLYQRILKIK